MATGIVLSPDGSSLAVLAGEGVHLIDTSSWTETARIMHATDPIDAAAFSPDGTRLATASKYLGQLAIWNSTDGSSLLVTPPHPPTGTVGLAPGWGLAFSSDGRRVATPMGTIVDVETGATVTLGDVDDGENTDFWFLPGDQAVAARTMYHTGDSWEGVLVETFNVTTGAKIATVGDYAVMSADHRTLAACCNDRSPNLTVEQVSPDGTLTGTTHPLGTYPAFDQMLAVTSHGEALLVRVGSRIEARSAGDLTSVLSSMELPPGQTFVAMSPADQVVTTGSCGTIAWDWRTGQAVWGQPFQVDRITWDARGIMAAATGPDALWRVWRTDTGESLCRAPRPAAVKSRVFSPDGLMVQTYDDGTLELRNADLSAPRQLVLPTDASDGTVAALGRGGRAMAVATGMNGSAGQIVVVNTATGDSIGAVSVQHGAHAVWLSPDGHRLAFYDSTSTLYDVVTGAKLVDGGASYLLGFDADDRRMATITSAGSAGTAVIQTYSISDGTPAEVFAVPAGFSFGLLSPDWSFAAGSPSPWTPDQIASWTLPAGPVQTISWRNFGALSFSSDGQLLFQTGIYYHEFTGDYPQLAIFDLATGQELENVIDHQLSPSKDGHHLFGQAGALFCR